MRTRLSSLIAVLVTIASLLSVGSLTYAQTSSTGIDRSIFNPERPQLDAETQLQLLNDLNAMTGPSQIIVELHAAATTEVFASAQASGATAAQATAQAQRHLATIETAQQTLQRRLTAAAIGAKVIYRTKRVFNGIAVQVDASRFAQIQALPGVKAIYPLIEKERGHSTSVPFIGAPKLWDAAGLGVAGEGISIGIIDTGIDYLHTNFGGPGTPEAYAANNTTVIGDSRYFPGPKVVGGYDFAGDAYNANVPSNSTPQPDPDPIDCPVERGGGHGTHVAGTAAGYGVNVDGSTYDGEYGTDTDFGSMRIGPGVAPAAELYALRVFGCTGSTNLTDVAIEWAVDPNGDGDFSDRLDVINMSLGSSFGSPLDSSLIATNNAVSIGIIVVASAGNSGDTYYISGAPGVAERAISVASSVDSGLTFLALRVNNPQSIAGLYEAAGAAFGPPLTEAGVSGDVVYPATNQQGCNAFPDGTFTGRIALIDRGTCEFSLKVANAQDAGAIAVVVVNNTAGAPIPMGAGARATEVRIPSMHTTLEAGNRIKAQLAEGNTVNVTLSSANEIARPDLADTLSDFSSRGPRRGDSFLKPDIAAPGQSITSAGAGTGSGSYTISGTSMAAPHVAGVMALLREIHPDWTVEELKALAMNTATNDVRSAPATTSQRIGPGRIGAGRVDVPNAATSQVIAYNADNPELVSVSFGNVEVVGTAKAVRKIRVLNKSDEQVSYNVAYDARVDIPGVEYTVSATSVTLQPYGSADLFVTMTANAAQMRHTRDQTVNATQALARHWLSEEAGYVVLTDEDNPTLRVPVHAIARPASHMRATSTTLDVGDESIVEGTIGLRGQQVQTGSNYPLDEVSLVSAFELQHSSPNDPATTGIADNGDLKYIGVSTDLRATTTVTNPTGLVEDSLISFGLATHGDWSTPNEVTFRIYIDTDQDGTYDYLLYNRDYARATGGTNASDAFITVLVDLTVNAGSLQTYLNGVSAAAVNTVPFNNNVMVIPVFAEDLGLTNANSAFTYRVFAYSRDLTSEDEDPGVGPTGRGFVDASPLLRYDAARPGIEFSNGDPGVPTYEDRDGGAIPFIYDQSAFTSNRSQGVLLLHHHNARGTRDDVVRFDAIYRLYAPLLLNGAAPQP